MDGPATELSLFDWPSIWKLFERPRSPFDENDAPLLLLKELLPVSATPGINSARASKPPFKGKSAVSWLLKLVVTCDVFVSINGAAPSTCTVSPTEPTSNLRPPSSVFCANSAWKCTEVHQTGALYSRRQPLVRGHCFPLPGRRLEPPRPIGPPPYPTANQSQYLGNKSPSARKRHPHLNRTPRAHTRK